MCVSLVEVLITDLLKVGGQQLFAVFGEPDARLHRSGADFTVELLGTDVYDPTSGEVSSAGTDGVAAWFLNTDYDRRSFLSARPSSLAPRWRRSLGAPRSRPPRLGRSRCLRDAPRHRLAALLGRGAGPRRDQGHRLPRQRGHQDPRLAQVMPLMCLDNVR